MMAVTNTDLISEHFLETLSQYPIEFQPELKSIAINRGILKGEYCQRICESLSINIEMLMVELLPLAASYSHAPISNFNVGAIVCGHKVSASDSLKELSVHTKQTPNLYFGANFEYIGQALCFSLHAEQSAISNAWQQGETSLQFLATSAAPCGHCRQFIYEVAGTRTFPILMPKESFSSHYLTMQTSKDIKEIDSSNSPYLSIELTELLPLAFGPKNLDCDTQLMQPLKTNLKPIEMTQDALSKRAFSSAKNSYAPYSKNFVGCAIELITGEIYTGRYAENAAHNPSLQAFTAAISQLILAGHDVSKISFKRVILAERPDKPVQKDITQLLLSAIDKNISLEYLTLVAES